MFVTVSKLSWFVLPGNNYNKKTNDLFDFYTHHLLNEK